jgi:hypothetical protein
MGFIVYNCIVSIPYLSISRKAQMKRRCQVSRRSPCVCGGFSVYLSMKKIILFICLALTSCTEDVYSPSYWVKNHSNKLKGNFLSYSIDTGDTLYAQFTPAYWDSVADQSINILWLSTLQDPQAYKFEEIITEGVSTYRVSRCDLVWDRDNDKWCYLDWITYSVVAHDVDTNNFITHMWTVRDSSTSTYIFDKL